MCALWPAPARSWWAVPVRALQTQCNGETNVVSSSPKRGHAATTSRLQPSQMSARLTSRIITLAPPPQSPSFQGPLPVHRLRGGGQMRRWHDHTWLRRLDSGRGFFRVQRGVAGADHPWAVPPHIRKRRANITRSRVAFVLEGELHQQDRSRQAARTHQYPSKLWQLLRRTPDEECEEPAPRQRQSASHRPRADSPPNSPNTPAPKFGQRFSTPAAQQQGERVRTFLNFKASAVSMGRSATWKFRFVEACSVWAEHLKSCNAVNVLCALCPEFSAAIRAMKRDNVPKDDVSSRRQSVSWKDVRIWRRHQMITQDKKLTRPKAYVPQCPREVNLHQTINGLNYICGAFFFVLARFVWSVQSVMIEFYKNVNDIFPFSGTRGREIVEPGDMCFPSRFDFWPSVQRRCPVCSAFLTSSSSFSDGLCCAINTLFIGWYELNRPIVCENGASVLHIYYCVIAQCMEDMVDWRAPNDVRIWPPLTLHRFS